MTDFERSLLASAKSDAMPADRKRALVAAFAGSAALSVAGAAKAATGAAAAAKKSSASIVLVKWIAAGALGTALVAGATKGALRVYETDASSPAAIVTSGPPSRAPVQLVTPAPVDAADPVAEPAPEPVPEPVAARAVASPPPLARRPVKVTARPLSEELAVIEKARAALASGDAASADRALDEHARSFPRGAFTDEARVLRIDAHARRGDRERTVAAARRYLAAHPDSPYGAHVRAYLEDRP